MDVLFELNERLTVLVLSSLQILHESDGLVPVRRIDDEHLPCPVGTDPREDENLAVPIANVDLEVQEILGSDALREALRAINSRAGWFPVERTGMDVRR
ncbi:MAG: hypothetical protein AAGK32_08530 [Actinomycetota bacterium]